MLKKLIWIQILVWYDEYLEFDFFAEKNVGMIKALSSRNPFIREDGQELFATKISPVITDVINKIDVRKELFGDIV